MKPFNPCFVTLLLVLAAEPPLAHAEGGDAERAAARALAFDAQSALESRDYAAAADRFARADALVQAPTLKLGLARAQVGLGQLLAARELYARIVREGAQPDASPAFKRAVETAKIELAALEARLPLARVQVEAPDPPPEAVAASQRAPTPAPLPSERLSAPVQPSSPSPPLTLSLRRRMGVISLGVGGAALGVGAVTGILAFTREGELKALCPENTCQPSERRAVDDYSKLRVAAGVTLVAGAALATTGALLFLTPSKPAPREAFIRPAIGPGYLGMEGAF
jgi:hypothetical protein